MTPRIAATAILALFLLAAVGTACGFAYNQGYWSAYYEMRNKLDAANRSLAQQAAATRVAIESRDASLIEAAETVKSAETKRDEAINDAQSKIPLSDACNACRVPAARIHGGVRP